MRTNDCLPRKPLLYPRISKKAHNIGVKFRSYTPGDKVWLNRKYIKTKRDQKLNMKFLGPFWVLHFVGKQAYKLELLKNWKVYNMFYILLQEQNIPKKGQVDKNVVEREAGNTKEYEVETIWDSAVNIMESDGHLLGFYYLVFQKGYPEEENT